MLLRRRGDGEEQVVRSTSPVEISSSGQSKRKKKRPQKKKDSSGSDVVKIVTPTLCFPSPSRLHDRLRESSLNLVVGTLGFQGAGKSTVLSSLASSTSKKSVFKVQSKRKYFMCSHETLGVEAYVSPVDRVLFLDSQAILSTSGFLHSKNKNKSLRFDSMYARSLHVTVFMLLVCDVVLLVQDKMFDLDLFRFLHVAEQITRTLIVRTKSNKNTVRSCARAVVVSNNVSERQSKLFLDKTKRNVNRNLSDSMMRWSDHDKIPYVCIPKNPTEEDFDQLDVAVFSRSEYLQKIRKGSSNEIGRMSSKCDGITERDWFHDAKYLWEEIEKVL